MSMSAVLPSYSMDDEHVVIILMKKNWLMKIVHVQAYLSQQVSTMVLSPQSRTPIMVL